MSSALWPIEEQTDAKHLILRSYLDGWFPILGRGHRRLLFIDGFAGPGEYEGGQPGSPVIALDCVQRHREQGTLAENVEVVFLFMEAEKARSAHLADVLRGKALDVRTKYHVHSGTFEEHMVKVLADLDEQNSRLAPSFVMIDPFGVKGIPMSLIRRILANDKSECMISFMWEPIRRFHQQPEYESHLDDLFGSRQWRDSFSKDEASMKSFLHGLFDNQLRESGATYVVNFELWRGNRHVYTLFFTSGSLKGCDLMKSVMWKVDGTNGLSSRGRLANQMSLFGSDTDRLAKQLKDEFGDQWIPVEKIE